MRLFTLQKARELKEKCCCVSILQGEGSAGQDVLPLPRQQTQALSEQAGEQIPSSEMSRWWPEETEMWPSSCSLGGILTSIMVLQPSVFPESRGSGRASPALLMQTSTPW